MSFIDALALENIMPGTFGSNYIGALIVLVVSFIAAKIISFVFEKILPKLIGKTKTDIDDKIVHAVHNPIVEGHICHDYGKQRPAEYAAL